MVEAQNKMEGEADEAKARHAAEISELKEYYCKTLGELDDSAKKTAEERAAAEAQRTMLQTNVRVAAGEVQSIRRIFNDLQQDAQTLKASLVPDLGVVSDKITRGLERRVLGWKQASCRLSRSFGARQRRGRGSITWSRSSRETSESFAG